MTSAILRIGKIKGRDHLRKAARHNLRTIPTYSIDREDADEPQAVEIISGPDDPAAIRPRLEELLHSANIVRPRRDAVLAIEFLVSLSDANFGAERAFFSDATDWLSARFGGPEHLLSAVVHRDEAKLHLHVLQVPLIDGRLIGSEAVGGPSQLREHIAAFQREVCAAHGLTPVPGKAGPVLAKRAWRAVLSELHRTADPILRSALWSEVQVGLRRDPINAATMLGLDLDAMAPKRRLRSSTSIFISKGKGSSVALP